MRPRYETSIDRAREEKVARIVAAHLSKERLLLPYRCPERYPCDWSLTDDSSGRVELTHLLEVKVRDRHYDEYMISLAKFSSLLQLSSIANAEACLAVFWEDLNVVGLANLRLCSRRSGVGGRADRGDWQDREPMIFIPMRFDMGSDGFTRIEPNCIV